MKFASDQARLLFYDYVRTTNLKWSGGQLEELFYSFLPQWPYFLIKKLGESSERFKQIDLNEIEVKRNLDDEDFYVELGKTPTKSTLLVSRKKNYENFDAFLYVPGKGWFCLQITKNENKRLNLANLKEFHEDHKNVLLMENFDGLLLCLLQWL
jgi:hypothetical protein